ncbi:MAG: hypothetical protein G01um101416_632 [Microgenomates group bacterium Gr01-1014_16]|nr:MAG: hypothetical protein G01um101416_632 [Microgenomates group bacterium Gr01-1014_16]
MTVTTFMRSSKCGKNLRLKLGCGVEMCTVD